jgi:hypothetical protein
MSTPFATDLQRPEDRSRSTSPSLTTPTLHFSPPLDDLIPGIGRGEHADSPAAPFARYAAKTSFPMTGDGPATTVASEPTDTSTFCNGYRDDTIMDDR